MEKEFRSDKAPGSKEKLLIAAIDVIRTKGYAAATIDDVCQEAGVTKGSFFHHFKSKDEMTLGTVEYWRVTTTDFFASADYSKIPDPLDRLYGYIQFRKQIVNLEMSDYTCLYGTLVQETWNTHPEFRAACEAGFCDHVQILISDLEAAKEIYCPEANWDPVGAGRFFQVVLQGSFVVAKTMHRREIVLEALDQLKSYLSMLFEERE